MLFGLLILCILTISYSWFGYGVLLAGLSHFSAGHPIRGGCMTLKLC